MEAGSTVQVWQDGRLQQVDRTNVALSSLCRAVERAVRDHQEAGVRTVVLMVDPVETEHPEPARMPAPVYVDVFESGYGYGV